MAYKEPDPVPETALDNLNPDLQAKDRMTRVESAIAMRVAGADYSEIAAVLEYGTVTAARQAVERGLASTVTEEDRKEMRTIANRRLERLLRAVMPKVVGQGENGSDEVLSGARTALAIVDRHIRLNGLDAPSTLAIYSPTDSEIKAFLTNYTQIATSHLPDEVDILEGEWTESDAPTD